MFQHIIVITRDVSEELPYFYELAARLTNSRARSSLFFTQGGVYTALRIKHAEEPRHFSRAKIDLWVDAQSARRRGFFSRHFIKAAKLTNLSAEALSPKTFILVDPPDLEGYCARRALILAKRKGLAVSWLSHEQTRSLSISLPSEHRRKPRSQASADWVTSLLERIEEDTITLTWVEPANSCFSG